MIECDCGEIPVVDDKERMRPIGVVTDRDIVVRAVAAEQDTRELKASECMTSPCITTTPEASLDECLELMQQHRIRRVPVVDENGGCCGELRAPTVAGGPARERHGRARRHVMELCRVCTGPTVRRPNLPCDSTGYGRRRHGTRLAQR